MNRIAAMFRAGLCCVPLMLAANVYAQLEGSLFTDPDEREYLDYLRAEYRRINAEEVFNIEDVDIPVIPDEVVEVEDTGPAEYTFDGAMKRSDGTTSIWLDGALLAASQLPEGFSLVESDRVVSLRIVRDGNTYLLRPGQTLDMTTGTVMETFQRVRAAAPEELNAPPAESEFAPSANPGEIDDAAPSSLEAPAAPIGAAAEAARPENGGAPDTLSSLVDTLAELTPAQREELSALIDARQEEFAEPADEATDAAE